MTKAFTKRTVCRELDPVPRSFAAKGVGHDFIISHSSASSAYSSLKLLLFSVSTLGSGSGEHCGLYLVITIEAGYLLGDVRIVLDVGAEGRYTYYISIHGKVELFEDFYHGVAVNVGAEQGIYTVWLQRQTDLLCLHSGQRR